MNEEPVSDKVWNCCKERVDPLVVFPINSEFFKEREEFAMPPSKEMLEEFEMLSSTCRSSMMAFLISSVSRNDPSEIFW